VREFLQSPFDNPYKSRKDTSHTPHAEGNSLAVLIMKEIKVENIVGNNMFFVMMMFGLIIGFVIGYCFGRMCE